MARYRKVDPRIWNDEKFRSFSHHGKLVFLFLMTHPHMTAVGAMRATEAGLADELNMDQKAFGEAFGEAFAKGMVEYDRKACFLALPNFLKYNPPESPNVVRAWSASFDLIPECQLKYTLNVRLKAFTKGLSKGFQKAFREAFGEAFGEAFAKGMPYQEQEQEQEQEQDKNQRALFDRFWKSYPRKEARIPAGRAFDKLRPDAAKIDEILAWIEVARKSEQWRDRSKIPHPATFLNQRRWEGDPPPMPNGGCLRGAGHPEICREDGCRFT